MTPEDRELDLLVAELEQENKMMRARNERLQQELDEATETTARLQTALARILAVSDLAFRDCAARGVGEVRAQTAPTSAVQRSASGLL